MPHCEEYLYHSAHQGLIDVPRLDENLVSVNPTLHLWPAREIWISWTLTCILLNEMRCVACDTTRPARLQYSSRLWWIVQCGIAGGGVVVSDLPLRECCYPSHNIHDDPNKPAVLIACYTVGQNAQRIGSLINRDSPLHPDKSTWIRLLIMCIDSADIPSHNGGDFKLSTSVMLRCSMLSSITSVVKQETSWKSPPYVEMWVTLLWYIVDC